MALWCHDDEKHIFSSLKKLSPLSFFAKSAKKKAVIINSSLFVATGQDQQTVRQSHHVVNKSLVDCSGALMGEAKGKEALLLYLPDSQEERAT